MREVTTLSLLLLLAGECLGPSLPFPNPATECWPSPMSVHLWVYLPLSCFLPPLWGGDSPVSISLRVAVLH